MIQNLLSLRSPQITVSLPHTAAAVVAVVNYNTTYVCCMCNYQNLVSCRQLLIMDIDLIIKSLTFPFTHTQTHERKFTLLIYVYKHIHISGINAHECIGREIEKENKISCTCLFMFFVLCSGFLFRCNTMFTIKIISFYMHLFRKLIIYYNL